MTSQQKATTPTALGEVAVWEAFRSLRVEQTPIHASLVRHMLERDVFAVAGNTLELGGGDGQLWRVGGDPLFQPALRAGALHITDADPDLVETARGDALFRRDGVHVEVANVEELPYSPRRFVRAVAIHVLHWCQTPERVAHAIGEIARVLDSAGRALVITVDEQIHMAEVYQLMQRARAALLERGVPCELEIPSVSPRVLPFCAANAPALLAASFEHVVATNCDYAHYVDAQHPSPGVTGEAFFIGYLRTLPFIKAAVEKDLLAEQFFDESGRLFRSHLAAHGTFRMSRRDVIYDCLGTRAVVSST